MNWHLNPILQILSNLYAYSIHFHASFSFEIRIYDFFMVTTLFKNSLKTPFCIKNSQNSLSHLIKKILRDKSNKIRFSINLISDALNGTWKSKVYGWSLCIKAFWRFSLWWTSVWLLLWTLEWSREPLLMKIEMTISELHFIVTLKSTESQFAWNGVLHANFIGLPGAHTALCATIASRLVPKCNFI